MSRKSAGILLYRIKNTRTEFFLCHPGGPFWSGKDLGAWTIPKGEFTDEEPLDAAIREFSEETGFEAKGPFIPLTPRKQKSGKLIYAWAAMGNVDPRLLRSNTFETEWPVRSGKKRTFPEIDRAEWLDAEDAKRKIHPGQAGFVEELITLLKDRSADPLFT